MVVTASGRTAAPAAGLVVVLCLALVASCAAQYPAPIPEALPPAGRSLSVNPLTAAPGAIAGKPPSVPLYGATAAFKAETFIISEDTIAALSGAPAAEEQERAFRPNAPAAEVEYTRGPVRVVTAPLPPTALPVSTRPAGSIGGDAGPTTLYPWAPSGYLNITHANGSFKACSGALVAPGVVLTAARCLLPYGGAKSGAAYPTAVDFTPALYDANGNGAIDGTDAPYGTWPARDNAAGNGPAIFIPRPWAEGTDVCAPQKGPDGEPTACQNDIAIVLTVADPNGVNVGSYAGYYGFSWNFFGASDFPPGLQNAKSWQTTSLGYPTGLKMARSDGLATWIPGSIAAVRGPAAATAAQERQVSRTSGGIGAPWIYGFGAPEGQVGGSSNALLPSNLLVGLTSFEEPTYSGSSLFAINDAPEYRNRPNIVALCEQACAGVPAAQRVAVCADRVAIPV